MKKSIRTIALIAALTLAAAPALHAFPMGTNPHPQAVSSSNIAYTATSGY